MSEDKKGSELNNLVVDKAPEDKTKVKEEIPPLADIPYGKFKEVNDEKKSLASDLKKAQDELETFKNAKKKKDEDKLIEDKQFGEVIKAKELEIETQKKENESLKKNAINEKINRKIVNLANKEGAIDSEDILRFIKIDDLLELESDKLDEAIKTRVESIKTNKGHLFGESNIRNTKENGVPNSFNASGSLIKKNMTLNEQVEASLLRSRKG